MFITYEAISWVMGLLWSVLLSCVLAPVALSGLALDYLRHWARKVSIHIRRFMAVV